MRAHGLRGTERVFTLPSPTHFALVGIQSSTSSTSELVMFTVNLMVVGKADWMATRTELDWLPVKPSANAGYPVASQWVERIGILVDGRDHWWSLDARGTMRDHVSREVVAAITNHGLPAMRTRMTT